MKLKLFKEVKKQVPEIKYQDIVEAIRRAYIEFHYHLQESYIFSSTWESDYFCRSKSGYFYEFEIKCSRSDFRADFKKQKHELFNQLWNQKKYVDGLKAPSRFFFVCPENLIRIDEVPPYAGLIYILEGGILQYQKPAPFIHKQSLDLSKILVEKFYFRMQQERFTNYELRQEIEKVKNNSLLLPDDKNNLPQG